jgi:molybdopterin-guanine dinucleotide biosynthesis protein A
MEGISIMQRAAPLSAAVLAGGKSNRMGVDKALLSLDDGGPTLLEIVLERLSTVADDVAIVGGADRRYRNFGVRLVPDRFPGGAALGGIATAIFAAQFDHCLVVACDMPFLSMPLLRHMASEPRDYDVLVPVLPGTSRQGGDGFVYQTLHAIYGRACLPSIERQLASGRFQVVKFFSDVVVRTISPEVVQFCDPELRSFFNANTPEALQQARTLHHVGELPEDNRRLLERLDFNGIVESGGKAGTE